MLGGEWFPIAERMQMFRTIEDQKEEIERLREALKKISLLPCEWVVHEIAVAALKGD